MCASLWRKRVKWLVRLKGPVSHFPGGTISWIPPSIARWLKCSIACRNTCVFEVTPSPTPPNSISDAVCFRQLIAENSKSSVNGHGLLPPSTVAKLTNANKITPEILAAVTCRKKYWKIKITLFLIVSRENWWVFFFFFDDQFRKSANKLLGKNGNVSVVSSIAFSSRKLRI